MRQNRSVRIAQISGKVFMSSFDPGSFRKLTAYAPFFIELSLFSFISLSPFATQERHCMATQSGGKPGKRQIRGGLRNDGRRTIRRHREACRIVNSLKHETTTEQFIPLGIRNVLISHSASILD